MKSKRCESIGYWMHNGTLNFDLTLTLTLDFISMHVEHSIYYFVPSGILLSLICYTVGSLNAYILKYNADNLCITLKLWGKLDENVSWVKTFPSHSSISLHFTRQNIAYRVTTLSMLATAPMLSTHIVLCHGNGCHKRATTLLLWGQRQFWGNFRFQPG